MTPDDVAFTFARGILQGGSISPQWLLTEPLLGSTSNNDITDQLDPDGSKGLIDNRDALSKEDPAALLALCQKVTGAIVADDTANTVTFTLAQPWGPLLVTLAGFWGGIQDKAWVGKNGGWDGNCADWQNFYAPTSDEQNGKAANGQMIGKGENGTGPYMLKEWGDQQMTMVANPNYWLKTPLWSGGPSGVAKIQTVIIKEIDEFATRFATFQAGDGDYIVPGAMSDWTQLDTLEGATCDGSKNDKCTVDHANQPAVRFTKQAVAARADAFFNFNINTEGGNDFIGSGKLDGNGVPPISSRTFTCAKPLLTASTGILISATCRWAKARRPTTSCCREKSAMIRTAPTTLTIQPNARTSSRLRRGNPRTARACGIPVSA